MKTHKILTLSLLLLTTLVTQAQSWQWAKSGGSSATGQENRLREAIAAIVTDSQGNVYTLSSLGGTDAVVNGVPITTYNFGDDDADALICSYTCTGALRWTRVLGGWNLEEISNMGIDENDNIYVAIEVVPGDPSFTDSNVRFEPSVVLSMSYPNTNTFKERLFLIKYNSNGDLVWYRTPQAPNLTSSQSLGGSLDLAVDPQGNCYWYCGLKNGSYANGSYIVSSSEVYSYHILKYDADGNFVNGFPIAYKPFFGSSSDRYPGVGFKFKRNHNNGKFYFVGSLTNIGAIINGQEYSYLDFDKYVCAFDSDGSFLWIKHNDGNNYTAYQKHDIAFDEQNNIYYAGAGVLGIIEPPGPGNYIIESWNGQQFTSAYGTNQPFTLEYRVLVKMDENGNNIWLTNGDVNVESGGAEFAVKVHGDEVITGSYANDYKWQNITYLNPLGNSSSAIRACISRFNKNTGAILGVDFATSFPGSYSTFSRLAIDNNGSIYAGGSLTSAVTIDSTTLYTNGGPDDFLLAKFGSNNCTFLGTTTNEQDKTEFFPNPVNNDLTVVSKEVLSYELFDSLGKKVQSGIVENTISFKDLPKGIYLLKTKNDIGDIKTEKIIKE